MGKELTLKRGQNAKLVLSLFNESTDDSYFKGKENKAKLIVKSVTKLRVPFFLIKIIVFFRILKHWFILCCSYALYPIFLAMKSVGLVTPEVAKANYESFLKLVAKAHQR